MSQFRYKAFISYSHKNSRLAAWLMRKLETYRLPPHLMDLTQGGISQSRGLGKIFRDREELSASGSFEDKLLDALQQSEFLIVVCSPDSAQSDRVNQEVREFISHRDSRNILCLIAEGEPTFESLSSLNENECIPHALRKLNLLTGQVPLAADARAQGDGRHKAVQKIIAGLLAVDLDELVQRDIRRKNKRLFMVAVASFGFAVLTTGLMLRAYIAESDARKAEDEAQLQQIRAEDLVGFMIEDLASTKLQQLGRMDVLDAVVGKVVDHYAQQDDATLPPSALARKARAYLQLGRLYLGRDLRDPANELFEYAYSTTKALVTQYPGSEDAIFAHATSLYWAGTNHIFNGRYIEAERAWRKRVEVAQTLLASENHSSIVWSHLGDINIHLGWALMELGRQEEAYEQFRLGLAQRKANAERFPNDIGWLNNLAGGYHHLQWAQQYLSMHEAAYENSVVSNEMYEKISDADPTDQRALGNLARSLRWRADTETALEKFSDARDNLLESLAIYDRLLAFEPDNMTFQYQACVSAVSLAELYLLVGDAAATTRILDRQCPESKSILALDHFKVHHRFYGYRLELVKLQLDLSDQRLEAAQARYASLQKFWQSESGEIQNSLQGQRVDLMLALQAVGLNALHGTIPDAYAALADVVEEVEASSIADFPPTVRLLQKARLIAEQAGRQGNLAR